MRELDLRVYDHVRIIGLKVDAPQASSYQISFANPHEKKFDQKALLRSNRLMFGSLVCLSCDGFNTFLWATVSDRDNKEFAAGRIMISVLGYLLAFCFLC